LDLPVIFITQVELGSTLWCQGRLDEAESYYHSALDGFIRTKLTSKADHTLRALACMLRDSGAAHVARYEIAKYISGLDGQQLDPQGPLWDKVEEFIQVAFSMDMKDF
jgi:hypothetical protein